MLNSYNNNSLQNHENNIENTENNTNYISNTKTIPLLEFMPEEKEKFIIVMSQYSNDKNSIKIKHDSDYFLTGKTKSTENEKGNKIKTINDINSLDASVTLTMILQKIYLNKSML